MVSFNEILGRREAILALAARYGARNVRVFGSVVRREAQEGSDVDLLVRMDKGRSLVDHVALIQDLEDFLGCRVDVVNERALQTAIRDFVLVEASRYDRQS
jgi:predicted nucleotidyltransferase